MGVGSALGGPPRNPRAVAYRRIKYQRSAFEIDALTWALATLST